MLCSRVHFLLDLTHRYVSLGDVAVSGWEAPASPVRMYRDDTLMASRMGAAAMAQAGAGGGDAPSEGPRLMPPTG